MPIWLHHARRLGPLGMQRQEQLQGCMLPSPCPSRPSLYLTPTRPATPLQAYDGNRAPVPIYMHMPWMTQSANQKYVQKFMDYVLDKPDQDVWVSPTCCFGWGITFSGFRWQGSGSTNPASPPRAPPRSPPFNPDPPAVSSFRPAVCDHAPADRLDPQPHPQGPDEGEVQREF